MKITTQSNTNARSETATWWQYQQISSKKETNPPVGTNPLNDRTSAMARPEALQATNLRTEWENGMQCYAKRPSSLTDEDHSSARRCRCNNRWCPRQFACERRKVETMKSATLFVEKRSRRQQSIRLRAAAGRNRKSSGRGSTQSRWR